MPKTPPETPPPAAGDAAPARPARKGPKRYHGSNAVAAMLDVDKSAITAWRKRFADTRHPFPAPDVEIIGGRNEIIPGWSDRSLERIRKWHATKEGVRPRGPVPGSKRTKRDPGEDGTTP